MSTNKRKRELIPPWEMPADPVTALIWFMHWSLKVLVRFFWLPIAGMMIYETYLSWSVSGIWNGLISGFITLLVGGVVWGILGGTLIFVNVGTGISKVLSEVGNLQQQRFMGGRSPFTSFTDTDSEKNVVEGTITDLDEERSKRRRD